MLGRLSMSGIAACCSIEMAAGMKIQLENPPAQLDLDVDKSITIAAVKEKIQRKKGIPPQQQTLFLDGKKLDDAQTISKDAILQLNLSLLPADGGLPGNNPMFQHGPAETFIAEKWSTSGELFATFEARDVETIDEPQISNRFPFFVYNIEK